MHSLNRAVEYSLYIQQLYLTFTLINYFILSRFVGSAVPSLNSPVIGSASPK